METEEHSNDCINQSLIRLDNTVNNFLQDNCSQDDITMIGLLKGIIVVEKETANKDSLFNQLKGNYFQSDLITAEFVNKLYVYDRDTLNTYFDIYLEQVFENEVTPEAVTQKISQMRTLIHGIDENLISSFNEKLNEYNREFKL